MNLLSNFNPDPRIVGLVLVGGILLLWFAMRWRSRVDAPSDRFTTSSRFFLVLLRLVIGWHLLIEGMEKLNDQNWSSEGYLREATGPLAPKFREIAGDGVVAQLTPADNAGALPPALVDGWQRHFDAFVVYYNLDEAQKKAARETFDKSKTATLAWMSEKRSVAKISPYPPELYVEWDVRDRLKEYDRLRAEVDRVEKTLPERGEKAWKEWRDAKSSLAKWRNELKKDVESQTAAFKKSLEATLSAEQKSAPAMPPVPRPIRWDRQLDVADAVVKHGLVAIGVCLIVGCFTRLAALCGAVLLLMFYLAMPALPYLPDSPKSEGHYIYVNKNIIEMIALLALASLQTGRWAGVDGLLQFLNPWNWPKKKNAAAADGKAAATTAVRQG